MPTLQVVVMLQVRRPRIQDANMNRLVTCSTMIAATWLSVSAAAPAPSPPDPLDAPPGATVEPQPAVVEVRDPEVVAQAVRNALRTAGGQQATGITVSTHAETIVLMGEVGSEAEVASAVAVAEAAAGNWRVSHQLTLKPGTRQVIEQESAQLVRDVEAALRRDRRTADIGIAVSIDDQQVIGLHGLVASRESRRAAEDVAARVKGVRQVVNRLVLPGE
jgi:osmotically-inducible protein OsmY